MPESRHDERSEGRKPHNAGSLTTFGLRGCFKHPQPGSFESLEQNTRTVKREKGVLLLYF
jgi:hypothetical protein